MPRDGSRKQPINKIPNEHDTKWTESRMDLIPYKQNQNQKCAFTSTASL